MSAALSRLEEGSLHLWRTAVEYSECISPSTYRRVSLENKCDIYHNSRIRIIAFTLIVAIFLSIISVIVYLVIISGNFNLLACISGSVSGAALVTGAFLVIYRVIHKKDKFAKRSISDACDIPRFRLMFMRHLNVNPDWLLDPNNSYKNSNISLDEKYANFLAANKINSSGKEYIFDLAYLDESKSGLVYVYRLPEPFMRVVSLYACVAIPIVTAFAVIYNLVRVVLAPIYIAITLLLGLDYGFKLSDIPLEFIKSIYKAIRAPFYALAYIFAIIYSVLDLPAGRVLVSKIEQDWNDGVLRSHGFWLITPNKFWKFEGGGVKQTFGNNGYYLMGCMQPEAAFYFKNGQVIYGVRGSLVAEPNTTLFAI